MTDLFTQPLPNPLPCPFCGSSNIYPFRMSSTYIWCRSCGATGPIIHEKQTAGNEIEAKAINRWNERTENTKRGQHNETS